MTQLYLINSKTNERSGRYEIEHPASVVIANLDKLPTEGFDTAQVYDSETKQYKHITL